MSPPETAGFDTEAVVASLLEAGTALDRARQCIDGLRQEVDRLNALITYFERQRDSLERGGP